MAGKLPGAKKRNPSRPTYPAIVEYLQQGDVRYEIE